MKREEWYQSAEFKTLRLLSNLPVELIQKTQQIRDVLEILVSQKGGYIVGDKYTIAERQLRVATLELENLRRAMYNLHDILSPHKFDDLKPQRDESVLMSAERHQQLSDELRERIPELERIAAQAQQEAIQMVDDAVANELKKAKK